ncbi:hypothetical protein [Thermoleptolyngbya sp. C42_A2020_037]|nr:hypothetical protein [Thermoleptolyngbya sp. C42_A2020_037]MBF2085562.1 hypothetical protein [Thermoleptolyngbya sp. C42_A2020_037]
MQTKRSSSSPAPPAGPQPHRQTTLGGGSSQYGRQQYEAVGDRTFLGI